MKSPESPLEEGEDFCSALCNWALWARIPGRFPACGQDRSLLFLAGQIQKLHWPGRSLSLHDVSPCSVLGVTSNLRGLGWVLLKYKFVGTLLKILAELHVHRAKLRQTDSVLWGNSLSWLGLAFKWPRPQHRTSWGRERIKTLRPSSRLQVQKCKESIPTGAESTQLQSGWTGFLASPDCRGD